MSNYIYFIASNIQGNPIDALSPLPNQVLIWNGSAWVPGTAQSGGSSGGVTYFLNQDVNPASPTTNLNAVTVKQLGTTASVPITTSTQTNLPSDGSYVEVAGFVTDTNVPGAAVIPAGIWSFNIWASSTTSNTNDVLFRVSLYIYDGSNLTYTHSSAACALYSPSIVSQYNISLTVPETSISITDRIYVVLEAKSTDINHDITFSFGDSTPSFVSTTIPTVQGTGVIHVVDGVLQSPATPVDLNTGSIDISGILPVTNGGTGLSSAPSNGQLLIGNGTGFTETTLSTGSGISVTNGAGSITITNTGTLSVAGSVPIASSGGQNPTISLNDSGVSAASYGTASSVPTIAVTSKGLISSAVNTPVQISESQVTNLNSDLFNLSSNKADKTTTITAGTGLTGGGDLSTNRTISMPLVGIASTYGSSTQTPVFTTDPQGRVTSVTNTTISGVQPGGAAGGDLSGTYPSPTVVALQTRAVPDIAPTSGQVLTWNGFNWVPGSASTGGSGGGGILYYFNQNTSAQLPVTGLTAPTVKQLGISADVAGTSVTINNVSSGGSYTSIAGFVTDVGVPGITTIPAGIWDFNIWASSTANADEMFIRVSTYKYNGTTATLLTQSQPVALYAPGATTQYAVSVTFPTTTILSTDRVYILLEAAASKNNTNITILFGNDNASHAHTTLPSVSGTGIVHVINGVLQSPASPVALNSSDTSGILPISKGGTGLSTTPSNGQLLIGNGIGFTETTLTQGPGVSITNGAGSITVGLPNVGTASTYGSASQVPVLTTDVQGRVSSVTNTSISIDTSQITSGTLPIARGGTGLSTTPSNGQLLIGNGVGFTETTLTQGSGVTITNGAGSVTVGLPNVGTSSTYGSASQVPVFTTDAQGRVSAVTNTSIEISAAQVTSGTFPAAVSVQNLFRTVTSQVSGGATPLAFGEVVYFTNGGGNAANPAVDRSVATSAAIALNTIGLVSSTTIPNGTVGNIINKGILVGNPLGTPPYLNTNGFTQGDILYVDPTTPGAFTNVKPSYPNFAVPIGIVIVKNQYTGAIFVDTSIGTNVADIVKIPAATSKISLSAPGTTTISSTLFNGPPAVSYLVLDFTGAGNVTLSTGPIQGLSTSDYGRILWIHNVSTKTVTFNSGGTAFLSGGVNLVLQPNSLVQFMWSFVGSGAGRWLQMGPAITVS